jgi:hypothetical protein
MSETRDAATALVEWFMSQRIGRVDAVCVMSELTISIIKQIAADSGSDPYEGYDALHQDMLNRFKTK